MHKRSSRKQAPKFGWLAILALGVILGGLFFGRNKTAPTTPTTASTSSSSSQQVSKSSTAQSTVQQPTEEPASSQVSATPASTTTTPANTTMAVSQIATGNLSSLSGTWTDSSGRSLTFDEAGLSQNNGSLSDYTVYSDGIAQAYITFPDGFGATIYFISKGTEFRLQSQPSDGFNYIDASDQSRDRILVGQSNTASSDPANFYYKQ